MAEHALMVDDAALQAARLRQFLSWLIVSGAFFGSVELVGFGLTGSLPLGLVAGMSLGYVGLACWAWQLVRQGALSSAVITLCVGLLAVVSSVVFILPARPRCWWACGQKWRKRSLGWACPCRACARTAISSRPSANRDAL